MFPELREWARGALSGFKGDIQPLSLDLKGASLQAVNNDWYLRNGYYGIYSALESHSASYSGESVTLQSALNHSVVWACQRAICGPVGFLSLDMMQRTDAGRQIAYTHPMYTALHDSPNAEMTAQSFRESMTANTLLQGNGYAQIIRRSGTGTAIELRKLNPAQVAIDREKTGQKRLVYAVTDTGRPDSYFTVDPGKPQDIFHLKGISDNGISGFPVFQMARHSIGTAIATERNVGRFFAAGGRVPYHLKMSANWRNDQERSQFREEWEKFYSDPHRPVFTPPGIDYEKDGLSARDSQMLEMRQFSIPEICRWFNVSPPIVGDLSRATFANVEQLALDHVKFCLMEWFRRWEQELHRCVLTAQEKAQGYYFKFNVNALLRGDFATRMAGYATMLQNGPFCIDEVRELEDYNPLPNGSGQAHHIQLNMATVPGTGDPMAAERNLLDRATVARDDD